MTKKKRVESIHPFAITAPKTKSSRWMTHIKTKDGERKKIVAPSEKKLYEKLYEFYGDEEKTTLESIYDQWLIKRRNENINIRTLKRNENHWRKYYLNHSIISIALEDITTQNIEDFFHEVIRDFNMTVKELNNMKFIIKDMLIMAKRSNLISVNPFLEVDIKTYACKPPSKKSDRSKIYLPKEKEKMFNVLNHELMDCPENTDAYAIFLLFKLGLRIGEVVAIRECDIDFKNNEIHIHRTETLEEDSNGNLKPVVVNHTKKKSHYGDRYLPLSDYEITLIESVKKINKKYGYKDKDYLFVDADGRTKIREIDNRIRKMCVKANIEIKSAHDIRRTVASEMFKNGVSVEIIRDFLGHSDIKTTWSYIYDSNSKAKTNRLIRSSLANMNGFKIS
jgi:integrase